MWTGKIKLHGRQGAGPATIDSIANLHINYNILPPGQATIAYIAHIANLHINCDIKLLGRQGPGLATIACCAYSASLHINCDIKLYGRQGAGLAQAVVFKA